MQEQGIFKILNFWLLPCYWHNPPPRLTRKPFLVIFSGWGNEVYGKSEKLCSQTHLALTPNPISLPTVQEVFKCLKASVTSSEKMDLWKHYIRQKQCLNMLGIQKKLFCQPPLPEDPLLSSPFYCPFTAAWTTAPNWFFSPLSGSSCKPELAITNSIQNSEIWSQRSLPQILYGDYIQNKSAFTAKSTSPQTICSASPPTTTSPPLDPEWLRPPSSRHPGIVSWNVPSAPCPSS